MFADRCPAISLRAMLKGFVWNYAQELAAQKFTCGYCGEKMASSRGYPCVAATGSVSVLHALVMICVECNCPTLLRLGDGGKIVSQVPGSLPGSELRNLPPSIEPLYREARKSFSAGAHTAVVLLCRKILLHVAAQEGATDLSKFVKCIEFLDAEGHIPARGRGWVDYIRQRGNEANHEIIVMQEEDARAMLLLSEQLLRNIYELPSLVPSGT